MSTVVAHWRDGALVVLAGTTGRVGDSVELRVRGSDGMLQWRAVNSPTWVDLAQIAPHSPFGEMWAALADQTAARAALTLGNVDNTSDAAKPVSAAQLLALNTKVDKILGSGLIEDAEKSRLSLVGNFDNSANELALATKVDKAAGKQLSDENYTIGEKNKLAGLESSKWRGLFTTVGALPADGTAGDYADVDAGVGDDVARYIWDATDYVWVRVQGASTELTPAQIKQQYESNPDTNAFTDDEKAKLSSVANGATANRADTLNADKVHVHVINDVTGLSTRLSDIDALIGDVESVLVAINGEP